MNERRQRPERDGETTIIIVRLIGVVLAFFQTATFYRAFPEGIEPIAWTLTACYAVVALGLAAWWLTRGRRAGVRHPHAFGLVSLIIDGIYVTALTWVIAFDENMAIFIVLYLVAIEGAFRYRMRGALLTMSLLGAGYVAREFWSAHQYGTELLPASMSFRIGVGLLIAAIAGGMAEQARAEHGRLVGALANERRSAEALRSLDELRSTFLAAVSHELRTPLTSILGFSLTIRDRAPELTSTTRMMLDQVIAESQQLERLLQDLLDIERMGRASVAVDRAECDVAETAAHMARRMQQRRGRRIEVTSDGARGVVDAAKVERIIDNLLSNAVKYSPDASPIHVRVARRGGGVQLTVEDHGPGVPESLRALIFAPFERGALTSSHQPGTGIGLSIVDRFARLHGGRAWVEDRVGGGGAAFHVFLPDGPPGVTRATVEHEPWGPTEDGLPLT